MTIKFSNETIKVIAMFSKLTRVNTRDCLITDNCIYFLVNKDKVGLVIGRNGSGIRDLHKILKKNIRVFGYSDDVEDFIRNLIPSSRRIEINDSTATVALPKESKVSVIGRGGSNIKAIRELLKRNTNISDLKVR
jgi:NusA-like KH domain protein